MGQTFKKLLSKKKGVEKKHSSSPSPIPEPEPEQEQEQEQEESLGLSPEKLKLDPIDRYVLLIKELLMNDLRM